MIQRKKIYGLCIAASVGLGAVLAYPAVAHAAVTVSVNATPTPAELAAARRALPGDFKETAQYEHHQLKIKVGHADLKGDGRPALILMEADPSFCGSSGCASYALLATPDGYSLQPIELALFGLTITVLDSTHLGMHDLRFDNGTHVFHWTGTAYQ